MDHHPTFNPLTKIEVRVIMVSHQVPGVLILFSCDNI